MAALADNVEENEHYCFEGLSCLLTELLCMVKLQPDLNSCWDEGAAIGWLRLLYSRIEVPSFHRGLGGLLWKTSGQTIRFYEIGLIKHKIYSFSCKSLNIPPVYAFHVINTVQKNY
jgi:hypothetical protein